MNPLFHLSRRLALAAATAASLLAACGGGDGLGSGGTGSAPETFATGTVDGFGSIFIGGERCDHIGARIAWDAVTGGPEEAAEPNPEVKLGQRVEVDLDGTSAACKILAARIAPEVIGVIESKAPLVVAGARVIVNLDPAAGPVTVFDGYTDYNDLAVGDRVEVHGKAVPIIGGGVGILATRIERKPATQTWVRVAGVIGNLTPTTFTLGGLTVHYDAATLRVPAGVSLRDGLTVAMWSTGAVTGHDVNARFIRVLLRQFADQQKVRVQGPVTGCAAQSPCTEPVIDGITVKITADTVFTRGSQADVFDGKTIHVRGTFDAASGKLVARAVAVRLASDGVVTLLGSVSDFTDDGTTKTFRVRGVPVSTDSSTIFGCALTAADNDKVVAVSGQIFGASVLAERIECPALAVGTIVDAYGPISQFDGGAKTFHLTNRPLVSLATLHWDDHTVFSNGADPATLANGDYVAVRGVYMGPGNGFLLLRVVKDQTPPASPGGLLFNAVGIAHHVSATAMWVNRVPMVVTPASQVDPGVVDGAVVRAWFYRHNGAWEVVKAYPLSW
ncbi:MAG: DUF5666 domain-containing protein [Burkholderiaceae bacterium]